MVTKPVSTEPSVQKIWVTRLLGTIHVKVPEFLIDAITDILCVGGIVIYGLLAPDFFTRGS